MTPAIKQLKKHKIVHTLHEYRHDPNTASYGLEAAEKLGVSADHVFKTLVVRTESDTLVVAILPVSEKLSMKHVAKAIGAKKVRMAEKNTVEKTTGYVLGGVSPFGQKKRLTTLLDASAQQAELIYLSAGKRGLEVSVHPDDVIALLNGQYVPLCHVE